MPLQTDPTVAYAHGEHLSITSLYKILKSMTLIIRINIKDYRLDQLQRLVSLRLKLLLIHRNTDYFYFLADKDGEQSFCGNV